MVLVGQPNALQAAFKAPKFWVQVAAFGALSALAIAIPTRLIPNEWFRRMTPTRPQDYVFLVASSALLGVLMALRSATPRRVETTALGAGVGTLFAVGCPVCNKLVVALLGTGGALSIFAPLQPVIALGAIGVLVFAIHSQLRAITVSACAIGDNARS